MANNFRILINERPVDILMAAAMAGIAHGQNELQTVAISIDTPQGELVIESNIKPDAAAPIADIYLRKTSGDPNAGPENCHIFTMDKPDESGEMQIIISQPERT